MIAHNQLKNEHNLHEITRIIKKSTNSQTKTIKFYVTSVDDKNKLLSDGVHIGFNKYKVQIWNTSNLNQCYKCLKFGHNSTKCTKDQVCPLCNGKHTLKQCTNRQSLKCANCNGAHTAFSKQCPIIKENLVNYANKTTSNKVENTVNNNKDNLIDKKWL